jgi:hypothetical protein
MHKRSVTSSPARRPPSDGRSSADAKRFGRPTAAHNGNRVVDLLAMFENTISERTNETKTCVDDRFRVR